MNLDVETPLEAVLETVEVEIARLQGVKAGIEDILGNVAPADPVDFVVDTEMLLEVGVDMEAFSESVKDLLEIFKQVANRDPEVVTGMDFAKAESESAKVDAQVLQELRTGLGEVVTDTPDEPPAPPHPDEVSKFLKNPPKPKLKIKKTVATKKDFGPRKLKAWTDEDFAILREMTAAQKPAAEIAKRLGRAVQSIYQAKFKLGITNGALAKAEPVGKSASTPNAKPEKPMAPEQDHRQTIIRPGPSDSSWSVFDDLELVRMFASGSGKSDIAIVLERTQQECVDRFNGLIGPNRRVLGAQEQLVKDLQVLCWRAERAAEVAAQ